MEEERYINSKEFYEALYQHRKSHSDLEKKVDRILALVESIFDTFKSLKNGK